jgi:hypothetical protein
VFYERGEMKEERGERRDERGKLKEEKITSLNRNFEF